MRTRRSCLGRKRSRDRGDDEADASGEDQGSELISMLEDHFRTHQCTSAGDPYYDPPPGHIGAIHPMPPMRPPVPSYIHPHPAYYPAQVPQHYGVLQHYGHGWEDWDRGAPDGGPRSLMPTAAAAWRTAEEPSWAQWAGGGGRSVSAPGRVNSVAGAHHRHAAQPPLRPQQPKGKQPQQLASRRGPTEPPPQDDRPRRPRLEGARSISAAVVSSISEEEEDDDED